MAIVACQNAGKQSVKTDVCTDVIDDVARLDRVLKGALLIVLVAADPTSMIA